MTTHTPRIETIDAYQWDLRVKLYTEADGQYVSDHITELNHTNSGYNRREEYLRDESDVPGPHEKFCSHYVRGCRFFHDAFRRYRVRGSPPGTYFFGVETGPNLDWYWPSGVLGPLHEPLGGVEPAYALKQLYDQETGFRSVRDPDDLGELRERGLSAMLPDIKPDLSLINSILELKDFKSLPRTLTEVQSLTRRLTSRFGLPGGKTLRRWVRGASDVHLQYAFGIGPLISDIVGLKRALTESKRQLKELVARRGIPQRHHYRLPLSTAYTDRTDVQSYKPLWGAPTLVTTGNWWQARYCKYKDASFHMTLDYSYDIVGAERELSAIDVLLDRIGVNLNPAIAWNAIRWTFVVDWIFNVSKWLNQFAMRNVNLRTVIHDCSWSITVDREITCELTIAEGDTGWSAKTVASVIHEKAYKRVPWSPDIYSSIRSSGVSSREASLLYSLFAVRIRR